MKFTPRHGIAVTVLALLLCVLQAALWFRSTAHVRSQTDEVNKESKHPPTELPGVAGLSFLVLAGVLISVPHPQVVE